MVLREEATSKDLATTRDARLARRRIERHERYLSLLRLAYRTRVDNGYDTAKLDSVIKQGEDELEQLTARPQGRILQRGRPKLKSDRRCTVYIDECGSHSLKAKENLSTFALAAVIIDDSAATEVDRQWKSWKRRYLGAASKQVHEPDVRKQEKSFYCGGDVAHQRRAVAALPNIIRGLNFTAIVCIVHRPEYLKAIGNVALDDSLPTHPYLMTLHFTAERVALALEHELGGAKARFVVESRGELEDAALQYEFARLFLDGTTYVSASWFRQKFLPGMEFKTKDDNSTGLQLADLCARPCADKIMHPTTTPDRWDAVRSKLCEGRHTEHSILGLKVIPWHEKYADVWTS